MSCGVATMEITRARCMGHLLPIWTMTTSNTHFFFVLFVPHTLDPLVQIICTSIKSLLLGLHNCTMSNIIITVHTSEHLVTRLCSYGSHEIQYPIGAWDMHIHARIASEASQPAPYIHLSNCKTDRACMHSSWTSVCTCIIVVCSGVCDVNAHVHVRVNAV